MFLDVMLDLETLGKQPGCTVLSVGAVAFDPVMGLGERFHAVISRADAAAYGLTEDPETLAWWQGQSREARETLEQATEAGLPLRAALTMFDEFLVTACNTDPGTVRIWGNGAGFDQPILRGAYAALGRPAPWSWWNDRCFRTLKGLAPELRMARQGTLHNALDDAVTQAEHAIAVLRRLRVNVTTL